jgi:ribosomal protein S18 acetylase RimI-like enzyme
VSSIEIRPLTPGDRAWADALLGKSWGGTLMVSRGQVHDLATLPGFVALAGDERVGLATYRIAGGECELTSLDSRRERIGVGSALVAAVKEVALAGGCRRLWLITTNDNTHALRFYQRRGFLLVAIHRDALAESRRLKPQIPLLGLNDIPLRDEIELELPL